MRRPRFGLVIAIAAVLSALVLPFVVSSPANAVSSGCLNGGGGTVNGSPGAAVTGAEIGEYPAQPSAQSTLKVACTFTSSATSGTYTIHDFDRVGYHQGAARKIGVAVTYAAAATQITVNSATAVGVFVNHGISGPGIPGGAFIKAVAANSPVAGQSKFTLNVATTGPSGALPQNVLVDNGNSRLAKDATYLAPYTTLTSATANFLAADATHSISGTGLADDTTITATGLTTTSITLSAPTSASAAIGAGSNGVAVTSFVGPGATCTATPALCTLHLASNTYVPGNGTLVVATSATTNLATAAKLSYTGKAAAPNTTDLTGVKFVSGSGTLATGGNVNVVGQVSLRATDITTSTRSVHDAPSRATPRRSPRRRPSSRLTTSA